MRYFDERSYPVADQRPIPKLLGSFECELHDWIEQLVATQRSTVINIGAAEGYYAVGMARRLPDAHVVAYEVQEEVQDACRRLAELNDVSDRVEHRGWCTASELAALDLRDAIIICDIEGGEIDVLDPEVAQQLRDAVLLVELHDCFRPGATAELVRRFAGTHEINTKETQTRLQGAYPELGAFSPADATTCLDEARLLDGQSVPQSWMLLVPSRRAASSR